MAAPLNRRSGGCRAITEPVSRKMAAIVKAVYTRHKTARCRMQAQGREEQPSAQTCLDPSIGQAFEDQECGGTNGLSPRPACG
jgi:hypothetical protein